MVCCNNMLHIFKAKLIKARPCQFVLHDAKRCYAHFTQSNGKHNVSMICMKHIQMHQAKSATHQSPFCKRVSSHIQIHEKIGANMTTYSIPVMSMVDRLCNVVICVFTIAFVAFCVCAQAMKFANANTIMQ